MPNMDLLVNRPLALLMPRPLSLLMLRPIAMLMPEILPLVMLTQASNVSKRRPQVWNRTVALAMLIVNLPKAHIRRRPLLNL